jgi:autotransporter-associated beta strand protein
VTGGDGGKAGGDGAADRQQGQGYGAGIFIMGDENITFAPAAGETLTISDQISDQSGSDPMNTYHEPGEGGVIVAGAGTVDLGASNNFTGGIQLEAGTLVLQATGASGSGPIDFVGLAGQTLEFAKADAPTVTLEDFRQGDQIEIDGFTTTDHSYAGGSLALAGPDGGLTLQIAGLTDNDFQIDNTAAGTLIVSEAPACYVRGSRIRTEHGERAVETLAIGDRVATLSGALKPIK